jgi:hypothetical protein
LGRGSLGSICAKGRGRSNAVVVGVAHGRNDGGSMCPGTVCLRGLGVPMSRKVAAFRIGLSYGAITSGATCRRLAFFAGISCRH